VEEVFPFVEAVGVNGGQADLLALWTISLPEQKAKGLLGLIVNLRRMNQHRLKLKDMGADLTSLQANKK